MDRRVLEQLLEVARVRERRAAAELAAAQRRVEHARGLQRQLEGYGNDYRRQAFDSARSGGNAGFLMDALAFGQRLQAGAEQQVPLIGQHGRSREEAQQVLVQARQRSDIAQRLADNARQTEERAAEARRQLEIEESISARHVARKLR